MRTLRCFFIAVLLTLAAASASFAQAPRIFFSDLESGPGTGGENNNGAFVTIYGTNFGSQGTVTVGGGAVAGYKAWGTQHRWYQKITFQLGPNARTGDIVVTNSAGTSNGLPFTVRSGNIYFVSTSGNDSNNGSFASPWRTLPNAVSTIAPGDIVYAMNGVTQSSVSNYSAGISVETGGTAGSPKALIAYPGAAVTVGDVNNTEYGMRVPNIGVSPNYWVFAGLQFRGQTIALAQQAMGWRVIGNDFSCPNANKDGNAWMACYHVSGASYIKSFGNYTHDSAVNQNPGATTKSYHDNYMTTDTVHVEYAWNEVAGSKACRGLQFHSSPLGSGTGYNQYDLSVHDNYIHDTRCDGLNFATIDPSKGKVEAYNNVITNTGLGVTGGDLSSYTCIYVPGFTNVGPTGSGTVELYNNTLYNCGAGGGGTAGAINADSSSAIMTRLRDNIVRQNNGIPYFAPSAIMSKINGSNNLYFGQGAGPSQTTSNVNADPMFVNAGSRDFHLQSGSPAIDAGTATISLDRDGNTRPQGSATDIGAYEFRQGGGGTVTPPPPTPSACDLNSDGSTTSADVDAAKSQALGTTACTNGDLDQNGRCDVVDVQRVINASMGGSCRVGQ